MSSMPAHVLGSTTRAIERRAAGSLPERWAAGEPAVVAVRERRRLRPMLPIEAAPLAALPGRRGAIPRSLAGAAAGTALVRSVVAWPPGGVGPDSAERRPRP